MNALQSDILSPVMHLGRINLTLSIVIIVLAFFVILSVSGYISRLINNVVDGLQAAAEGEGDLTRRLESNSKDEIGKLVKWFNLFVKKVQEIIIEIAGNCVRLREYRRLQKTYPRAPWWPMTSQKKF